MGQLLIGKEGARRRGREEMECGHAKGQFEAQVCGQEASDHEAVRAGEGEQEQLLEHVSTPTR